MNYYTINYDITIRTDATRWQIIDYYRQFEKENIFKDIETFQVWLKDNKGIEFEIIDIENISL